MVGRERETKLIQTCLKLGKHLLVEGPVGVGKTHLVKSALKNLEKVFIRIDGDQRYSEQKMVGGFDPALVMKQGFQERSFLEGPLVQAMKRGEVLFINELNRMPEGVQNILLPAIDEGIVMIPKIGVIQASKGFSVIATQNPKEFVATTHLSEAILDRFELLKIDYQSKEEEIKIIQENLKQKGLDLSDQWVNRSVDAVRNTRDHPKIRRGASIRAAMSLTEIFSQMELLNEETFSQTLKMTLSNRIEIESASHGMEFSVVDKIFSQLIKNDVEKKNL